MSAAALIRDGDGLAPLVGSARAGGVIGLDTEFMRERTFRAQLCLVQVVTPDDVFVVDPLELDLGPIAELVADPGVEVLLHAAKQDLELFYDGFGVVPAKVFDVQLAAGFAGYGASLSYGKLVEATLGVALEKGESYTDWCKRPLTSNQLVYAADDVRYLLPVAELLKKELERDGRLGWVTDEMRSLEHAASYENDPRDAWLRVKGRGTLSGRQLAVLRELAAWREEEAARRDLPRGWILKDPTLIELARRSPARAEALGDIRGLATKEAQRSGRAIVAAIARGRDATGIKTSRPPSRAVQARARMLAGLADAVVRARCEAAGVATELVATRGEVEALLVDLFEGGLDETGHRVMRGWRRELVGDAILGMARGEVGVRAIDRPPYVQEVKLSDG